jgi:DNA-binding NtrC family response regulator
LLVVEDDRDLRDTLVAALGRLGYLAVAVPDGEAALVALAQEEFDLVLLDLRLPRKSGIEVLHAMRAEGQDGEIIIVTGHADVETAIEALKLKAFDYILKPFRFAELTQVVGRAAEHRRLRRENQVLRRAVSQRDLAPVMLGHSRTMDRLRDLLQRAGQSGSHVLIQGESGSGKELAARAVHGASARRDLPFLAINCAALPDELLESELFGHERGAFTGAAARRHGLLELAHDGTLFLDEVAEMSPLRERAEDISLLVECFAAQIAGHGQRPLKFTAEAMQVLTRCPGPGNVRELRNVVERLAVMASGGEVTAADVALHLPFTSPEIEGTLPSLDEVERRHILKVLQHTGGNRARAAKILDVDPKTLYNKLKTYSPSG